MRYFYGSNCLRTITTFPPVKSILPQFPHNTSLKVFHKHYGHVYVLRNGKFWYNWGMAILREGQEIDVEGTKGQLMKIYNGDWAALQEITKKWNFKDEESALRFALAVLTQAEDGTLQIGDSTISPAEGLLKHE